VERVPAVSSEKVEAAWRPRRRSLAAQANWWPALLFHPSSPTKYYQTWLVANCQYSTGEEKSSIRFPRVYKPLKCHLLSILSKSDLSPLGHLSGPFKQRISRNATLFSCLLSLTHFAIISPGPRGRPTTPPFRTHSCLNMRQRRGSTPTCPHLF
jgi:hypothetical protein